MIKAGIYALTYATIHGTGDARVYYEDGVLTGTTDRGTELDGWCRYDTVRKLLQFEVVATVPPHKTSITGLTTDDKPRAVTFKGEVPPSSVGNRFSIDFAGRAVDIMARYEGPIDEVKA